MDARDTLQEAIGFYGYTGAGIHRIEPTWAERLFRFLTNPMVAGILLMLAVLVRERARLQPIPAIQ